jgi:hypothetical protein
MPHVIVIIEKSNVNRGIKKMTNCHFLSFYRKKKLTVNFSGGDITSEGGLLLLKEFESKLKLVKRVVDCIKDKRNQAYTTYSIEELFTQRFYSCLAGYEDCNDAKDLRKDPTIKAIVNRKDFTEDIASQPTLSRLENMLDMKDILALNNFLVELFLEQHSEPEKLVLDIDGTDIETHGHQQLSLFHGYYGHTMYSPLIISANGHFLNVLLRKGNAHGSWGVIPRLQLVIGAIRKKWKEVKITIRIDAGGAKPEVYDFCELNGYNYVIGLTSNAVLKKKAESLSKEAETLFNTTQTPKELFGKTDYQAASWERSRNVIMKAKHSERGANRRFVVTDIEEGTAEEIYKNQYSPRGEFERILDDLKNGFNGDRLSCHELEANNFRLFLAAFQYETIQYFKDYCLKEPEYNAMQPETLRRMLIKIGARVKISTRRLWFELSSSCPYKNIIATILSRIKQIPE